MATWNRQPTGDGAGVNEGGKTQTVVWVAAGLLTPQEALDDPAFPVTFNDAFPDEVGSLLKARQIRVNTRGFRVQSVSATYSVPQNGTSHESEDPSEPTANRPLIYDWQTVSENVAIDRDATVDANPILTSSRRHPAGVTKTRNYKRLTITRWEDAYNPIDALAFENTVNDAAFEGAATGEVKCVSIAPSQSFEAGATLFPIAYVFDFKPGDIWGDDPWQTWLLDADHYAFALIDSVQTKVRILTSTGSPAGVTLLDDLGQPVGAGLTYREAEGGVLVTSPNWDIPTIPAGATVVQRGDAVYLVYQTSPEKDFTAFGL